MSTIRQYLHRAQAELDGAIPYLERARRQAEARSYAPSWLAAIDKALRTNQENIIHIGNIAAELTRHERLSPTNPVRKEN